MTIDGLTLSACVKELNSTLINSRIDKINQPEAHEIVLSIRLRASNKLVIISTDAQRCRVHITDVKKPNPIDAPMFCMLLRKHLTGGRIKSVYQVNSDRIVVFEIESMSELYEVNSYKLICEIMGRQSNVILTNEQGIIIDSLRRVGISQSMTRPLLPNIEYQLPPTAKKIDPKVCAYEDFLSVLSKAAQGRADRLLSDSFYGIAPVIAGLFIEKTGIDMTHIEEFTPSEKELLAKSLYEFYKSEQFTPCIIYEEVGDRLSPKLMCPFVPALPERLYRRFASPSEMLNEFYSKTEKEEFIKNKSATIRNTIKRHIERLYRKKAIHEETISKEQAAERYRLFGELITANLYQIKAGQASIIVPNYYTENEPVEIPFDVTLTPVQNANRYYKLYNKAKTAKENAIKMLKEVDEELEYLTNQLNNIDMAESLDEIREIHDELAELNYIRPQKTKSGKLIRQQRSELNIHREISPDGFAVLVGKNNKQNDYITQRLAKPNDIWLHIKDFPGGHVVIQTNDSEVPDTTLEFAARLAYKYSSQKNSGQAFIDYTLRKYVKKPSNALPGKVYYTNYKTILIKE
ncbi:MAG TPA: fibronectin/fibrinogen-binding protein [Clostridiales bacterium]|jgi:predicted ribosome quality control (RQC) complex YloA/Tae2 family protein|nr:fibronectin/fibrinogen-binding protein [Clostridiales bacterium]